MNLHYKDRIKQEFITWYSSEMSDESEESLTNPVDLRASIIKPMHARWIVKVHQMMEEQEALILAGFSSADISQALDQCPEDLADTDVD